MKILILSNYPWKNNNSFGNTYTSIFDKVPNIEIAHIYLYEGRPDYVPTVKAYFHISERQLMKSVFKRSFAVGERVFINNKQSDEFVKEKRESKYNSLYGRLLSFGKRHHWNIMFIFREMAWKLGKIDYAGLFAFIDEFKPDLFFMPYSNVFYSNKLALEIKNHYKIPMVLNMMMDHYTLNRVSWNPFFWLDRFAKRRLIRKMAKESEMIFVISQKLKDDLERNLQVPCKVLYKAPDMDRSFVPYQRSADTIRFVFTGNIYANRWKSLAMLANELQRQEFGHLDIYTASPISSQIDNSLNIEGTSTIHPPISQEEVIRLQNSADILVHTEAFDKYNKSLVRCAISTKIMDYLCSGRCILAIGPSDISSVEYLADNDLALIASSQEQLSDIICRLKRDTSLIEEYALRGRKYAVEELDEYKIKKDFSEVLNTVITEYYNKIKAS